MHSFVCLVQSILEIRTLVAETQLGVQPEYFFLFLRGSNACWRHQRTVDP